MAIDWSFEFWSSRPYQDVFEPVYDLIIFGGGFTGFAAAREAHAQGRKVLLVDRRGDLLWELTRGFSLRQGQSRGAEWQQWLAQLEEAGASCNGCMQPGLTELVANRDLLEKGVPTLYYAAPIAAELEDERLWRVAVSTRAGIKTLKAHHWLDATETGLLARLCDPQTAPPSPIAYELNLFLQAAHWPDNSSPELTPGDAAENLRDIDLITTGVEKERALHCHCEGDPAHFGIWIEQALKTWQHAAGELAKETHLSHASMEPVPIYGEAGTAPPALPENVQCAAACYDGAQAASLAERFDLGLSSVKDFGPDAKNTARMERAWPVESILKQIPIHEELQTAVCIAGLGTAGAIAAIAAGRAGATHDAGSILAIEPLAYAGGIGTAGGIHGYYYGVQGGLQQELDERTVELMNAGGKALVAPCFHPVAKRMALGGMLAESGARLLYGAELFHIEKEGSHVKSALVVTPRGIIRVLSHSWLDCTGDGHLALLAGAKSVFGRRGDGQPSAFSQSSGLVIEDGNGLPRMRSTNFDAGWCDPCDSEDLTRARMLGIDQNYEALKSTGSRLLYFSPALGLRQGPQIQTDYVVNLSDGASVRRFDDGIGYYACHMDTHNQDLGLDDDPAVFWKWVLRPGKTQLAGQIPYRALLPQGLDNVWIASRALGVTQEMHYSLRMMRDMQRIGEAAALAGVQAARRRCGSRQVDLEQLRTELDLSGALKAEPFANTKEFGAKPDFTLFQEENARGSVSQALKYLDEGNADVCLWALVSDEEAVRDEVRQRLRSSDREVRFIAAGIAAQWGEPQAQEVLLEFIRSPIAKDMLHTVAAVPLLRQCGDAKALPVLKDMVADPGRLSLDMRILCATLIETLLRKNKLREPEQQQLAAQILSKLEQHPIAYTTYANAHLLFDVARAAWFDEELDSPSSGRARESTREDHTWQLDLVLGRALLLLGQTVPPRMNKYLDDPRLIVRRGFSNLLTN